MPYRRLAHLLGSCGLLAILSGCASHDEGGATPPISDSERTARALAAAVEARFGVELQGAVQTEAARRARVVLPDDLSGAVSVTDTETGLTVRFGLRGDDAVAEEADGVRVYRGTHHNVFLREISGGLEDFVELREAPSEPRLGYDVDVSAFAGLRLVGGQLEFLDVSGIPRLRVKRPYLIDAAGQRRWARLDVEGCAVDRKATAPFRRPVTPPGAVACELTVSWDDAGLSYPIVVDPAWTTTGSMASRRRKHDAVLLADGTPMVAGGDAGYDATAAGSSELYDATTGTWAAGAPLNVLHPNTQMVLMRNGDVLLVGDGLITERRDVTTGNWSVTGSLVDPIISNGALVAFVDNKVLLAGGQVPSTGQGRKTGQVYDATTGMWSPTANEMSANRRSHSAVRLNDGRALVMGGYHMDNPSTDTAQFYDPTTNMFSDANPMSVGRGAFDAVTLASGEVLVVGGRVDQATVSDTAEVWNPTTGNWTAVASMPTRRVAHSLHLLQDNRVLLINGRQIINSSVGDKMSRLFDPALNTWVAAGELNVARGSSTPGSVTLDDGRVLTTGGVGDTTEVFAFVDNGDDCSLDAECSSGFCVEGKCCDSRCDAACQSCRASDKASGPDGTCGPIAGGNDPLDDCGSCEVCDGAGACGPAAAGTDPENDCIDSGSPACRENGFCDGAGSCQMYSQSSNCAPTACSSNSECASNFCVEGVCCDSACGGDCVTCLASKKDPSAGPSGVCEPIAPGTDPDDDCEEGPGFPTSCLADGMCDGAGACRVFAETTVACGATSCSGNFVVGQLCNGGGTCAQAQVSCDPYKCSGDACLDTCTDNNDCIAGAFCSAQGTCSQKLVDGSMCSAGQECQSGFCVDGFCCNSACTGQCEACDITPNEGTCGPVSGDPRGSRPECGGDDECGGSCNGVNPNECTFEPAGTACGDAGCEGGVAKTFECNGQGSCSARPDDLCAPYVCAAGACLTSCQEDDECASGFVCDDTSACSPAPDAACSEDLSQSVLDGAETECSPYLCNETSGNCREICSATTDCAPGFVCDTQSRVCVSGSSDGGSKDDGGCGCRTAGGGEEQHELWLLLGLLGLMLRRRVTSPAA